MRQALWQHIIYMLSLNPKILQVGFFTLFYK